MNEFERRSIEVLQNHRDIQTLLKSFGRKAIVEYFAYSARIGTRANPLVAGVKQQTVLAIQSDAYFVLQYVSVAQLPSLNANPQSSAIFDGGNFLLQITDTGAGATLYSAESLAGILTGTVDPGVSGIPMLLPIPRLIPPNTNIKIEITQLGTQAINQSVLGAFVCLMGARIVEA